MSSTMRTEIFFVILTLGLGTLVHFGKSQMFSALFVELKAEQELNHFFFVCQRRRKMNAFTQPTFSYGHARHGIENDSIYIQIQSRQTANFLSC